MGHLLRLSAAVCGVLATAASASEVWVVTDQQHSVRAPSGVRIIDLDAPRTIQRELFAHLPPDPTQAAAIAKQRLKQGGPELQERLAAAYQAVADAWRLGVSKIPAVIVDKRFVVYGEPDVERAVSWIEDYRRTHP